MDGYLTVRRRHLVICLRCHRSAKFKDVPDEEIYMDIWRRAHYNQHVYIDELNISAPQNEE